MLFLRLVLVIVESLSASLFHHSPLPRVVGRSSLALLVDNNLVIHSKFALWHSTQIALHHNTTRHVGTQDLAWSEREGQLQSKLLH